MPFPLIPVAIAALAAGAGGAAAGSAFGGDRRNESEDRTESRVEYNVSREFSSQDFYSDSRTYQQDYTYAPQIITNSPGATAAPVFKKEQRGSQTVAEQTATQQPTFTDTENRNEDRRRDEASAIRDLGQYAVIGGIAVFGIMLLSKGE